MNKKIQARIYALVGVVAVFSFFWWADKHDQEFADWAVAYEACVQEEYGRSASSYYQEHGEYPECDTTK